MIEEGDLSAHITLFDPIHDFPSYISGGLCHRHVLLGERWQRDRRGGRILRRRREHRGQQQRLGELRRRISNRREELPLSLGFLLPGYRHHQPLEGSAADAAEAIAPNPYLF